MVMVICALVVRAQISPGDLSKPHAHLEGMANCTKCHVLGDKVTNAKCLDCHKEIKSRVDQGKGYHASTDVSGKDCFSCHSEHHGRNFQIVRFDKDNFNHALTGYKLTGAHARQDCAACHKDERIESAELRKKEITYLGLKTDCIGCHKDVHQNTLSTDCKSCHLTDAFKPATLFDHAKADFPLKGKHKEVDCRSCHEVTFQNGALYQRFSGVPFNSCASCHTDVHEGRLGTDCKSCHTEESFQAFTGKSTFNHNQTQFPLAGKHKKLNCASCHNTNGTQTAEEVFQDFKGKDFNACTTCHKDVHESRFGVDCKSCHTEESFQKLLHPESFNHTLTGFVLEGKHMVVDCRKCHETKMTDPLPHQRCMDCHEDFHEGQFNTPTRQTDCRDCHTTNGFEGASFTVEQHNQTSFPLTGAHLATPCIACHLQNDQWTFRGLGKNCVDCHQDIHEGKLDPKFYPQKTCNQCHQTESWATIEFDHSRTNFELVGKHKINDCVSCHQPVSASAKPKEVPFTGLQSQCNACHENIHERQFEVEGVTDCERCHSPEAWSPSLFDHNTARFKLEGAHQQVECRECHISENIDGRPVIKYRLENFACVDCHTE